MNVISLHCKGLRPSKNVAKKDTAKHCFWYGFTEELIEIPPSAYELKDYHRHC
jgi:hypothetical protein